LIRDDLPSAGARQQDVVGRVAFHELARVLLDQLLLGVDALKIFEADAMHVPYRLDVPAPVALSPAKGDRGVPIGRRRIPRHQLLQPREKPLGLLDQFIGVGHVRILTAKAGKRDRRKKRGERRQTEVRIAARGLLLSPLCSLLSLLCSLLSPLFKYGIRR